MRLEIPLAFESQIIVPYSKRDLTVVVKQHLKVKGSRNEE